MRRWARRLGGGLLVFVLVLTGLAIVTARRGDPRLYPAMAGTPGVEVFVVSHGYHAGIVLPRAQLAEVAGKAGLGAASAIAARFAAYRALEIGWGDEGFYTSVPTVASLTIPMALRALFRPGNPSVVHVVGLNGAPSEIFPNSDMVRLNLSEAGFARLVAGLDGTLAPGQGSNVEELGRGLYGPSLFYRAVGSFHLFRLCNHWVADLLDAAGVPTAPVLATLPHGLLLDLRWRSGAVPPDRFAGEIVSLHPWPVLFLREFLTDRRRDRWVTRHRTSKSSRMPISAGATPRAAASITG